MAVLEIFDRAPQAPLVKLPGAPVPRPYNSVFILHTLPKERKSFVVLPVHYIHTVHRTYFAPAIRYDGTRICYKT